MLSLLTTIPCRRIDYRGFRSVFAWKRARDAQKAIKSLARYRSNRPIARTPSRPVVRLPPLTPRKRVGSVSRQTSSVRLRAAALRAKRFKAHKMKRPSQRTPPPKTYRIPDAQFCHKFRPETAQDKLNAAHEHARRHIPRPHTFDDAVFIQEMAKLNVRHSFVTENFKYRVMLDENEKMIGERMKQQAEHDARARVLRAQLKQQQLPAVITFPRPSSSPLSNSAMDPGKIPLITHLPVQGNWSLWDKVTIGLDKVAADLQEERRRKEEVARAREAAGRAEQARIKRQTAEQQEQERIRRAWMERIIRETELEEQMKVAEDEEETRRKATVASPLTSAPRFGPPQTVISAEYLWELYERRWAAIKQESMEGVPLLTFDMIPWPQIRDAYAVTDLAVDDISIFLLSTCRPGNQAKTAKERLRRELLLFHPDKFNTRVLRYVAPENRALVIEGAVRVTVILHGLLQDILARG